MFGQSSTKVAARWPRSKPLEALHGYPSAGSQNPDRTLTYSDQHYYAESNLNRAPDSICPTSIHHEGMNTHIGHLKVPVTCMPVFPALSIFLVLSLYNYIFVPVSRRITGHPHGTSQLQRVGIGMGISILSVAWAGVFERFRRNYAIRNGYEASFLTQMPDLSAFWLLIQYCLIGIAEVFCIVGLLEFLYEEAPDAMRSIGSVYAAVAGGLGCFAATILHNIANSITEDKGGRRPSWLSQNINNGRYDYLYWLLTGLSIINFCGFLYAARRY